jgi:hypothetical protein
VPKDEPERPPPPPWPPVDFPLFGLDEAWTGPRWLRYVWGAMGQPAPGVSLAHGDRVGRVRGHPSLVVTTWRPSGVPWADGPGVVLERELAWDGLYQLMNGVGPWLLDDDQRRRFRQNFVPYLATRSTRWASWAPAEWTINGKLTTARFARFAGGWAGWAFELDKFAVTVVASGASPHGVHLSRISSGAPYHFDLHAPISNRETLPAACEQALGRHSREYPPPRRLHSDVRKLIYNDYEMPPGESFA